MKKSIISAFFLILVLCTLGYFVYDAKLKSSNFFIINNSIKTLKLLNKDFDIYLKNTLVYDNFDIIQKKIYSYKNEFNKINNSLIKQIIKDSNLKNIINSLNKSMQDKFETIDRIKSYRAILNNSFRIIQKIKYKGISKEFNEIYTVVMTSDKNLELDIKKELKKIDSFLSSSVEKYERYFLLHSNIILKYQLKFMNIKDSLEELNIDKKLERLDTIYKNNFKKSIKKAQISIGILFALLIIILLLYFIDEYKLKISNKELYKFKKTVESGDNIIVITDKNEIIKYVNEAFLNNTGYTIEDVIGKKPSILKSGKQSKEFYEELYKTIHSGKKWSGEFINKDKKGDLKYEKASITPLFDDDGKIKEFIAIKLDITKERLMAQQLKEKEKLLLQQSKMAAMGEMIENIAHQWRQPLSVISTLASGLQIKKELNLNLSKEKEFEILENINNTVQHLSETINNFRNFFSLNKKRTNTNLKQIYIKTINLINAKFKSLDIEIIEELDDIELNTLEGEVVQVIMNILNNAKDILETIENQRKLIFVNIYKKDNNAIIEIIDNAKGVPFSIIDKIFEPYFTTKHQSQGTGIGLYMSQEIVVKHLKGKIDVQNISYTYEGINYTGAKFTIVIPIL